MLFKRRETPTTLVVGGNGKTGSRVIERLAAEGRPVRSASRSGDVRFDWNDRSTWAPALDDVGAVYIAYYPDLAFPGAAETVGALADLAVSMGVRRQVLLSGRNEEGAQAAEERLKQSGADYTLVRCDFFNQNFSETFVEPVRHGVVALPGSNIREPFLDAEDIADVVVAALGDERHVGQLYELTGPRLMTLDEVALELESAVGRPIRYVPMSTDDFADALTAEGIPLEEARAFADLIAEVLDGRNSYLTDGVQQALGRPARDFSEFARTAAADGAFDLEEVAA
jgi:uncharacterized protein YbjT (DUF2867 family)